MKKYIVGYTCDSGLLISFHVFDFAVDVSSPPFGQMKWGAM